MKVNIPHNYVPRHYQLPFLTAMDDGKKRACVVWHRRSGKSLTLLNLAIKKAFQRVGTYYHAFPEYNQAKKVVWDGINKDGKRIIDHHIPEIIRKSTNKTEMKIELINGSVYQLIGADTYNSLVGPNPVGIILDEWAVSDSYPLAWDYFRPILAENQGWAVFGYTPRGRNHGFSLYQMAQRNPEWYCELLGADSTGAISREDIERERDAGMSEDMIQQEFYCSFVASTEDIVIPFEFIQAAMSRVVSYSGSPRMAGLDVARFGDDRSSIVVRQGGEIQVVQTWRNQDTLSTAGRVIDLYEQRLFDAVAVDVIGIGAGVADQLQWAGIPVVAVNVAESPANSARFARLRDELWWKAREFFMDRGCSISTGIPVAMREALISDISDIHYSYTPVGKILVEDKAVMKKRLGFSPDIGDALCLSFHPALRVTSNVKARDLKPEVRCTNWSRRGRGREEHGGYQEVRV